MDRTWTQEHRTAAQKSQQLQSSATCKFPDAAEHEPPQCSGRSWTCFTRDGKSLQGEFLKLCPTPPASSSKSIHDMTLAPQGKIRSIRAEIFPATKCSLPPLPIVCPWVPKQEDGEAEEPTWDFSLFPQDTQTSSSPEPRQPFQSIPSG